MKKSLILPALLLGALTAQADVLSPAAALNRAAAELPASASAARRIAARATAAATPLLTVAENALEPELYVFAADGGVVVASAESEAPALLGYSDFYSVDSELPPSMQWLLNQYAAEIRALRAGNVIPAEKTAASRADFATIEPICATRWNQGSPFNEQCPKLNSKATYTGCVATAMAQVLKVMEYPEKCVGGTYSYHWENGNKTLSKNFNDVTLDWKNMDDVYTVSSFSIKRKAVANLMAAVGYASDMNYGTDASGAHGLYACAGLIRNFNYEYNLQYLMRDWFPLATWQQMVYDELAAGRAVYYDGVNTQEKVGHAFVVDGYQADGYFHINWGWGGALDGYFLLTALNPDGQQGIGGSSGGYSEQAGAMFGLTPGRTLTADNAPLTFAMSGNLTIRTSAISLGSYFQISFGNGNGVFNYSPYTVPKVNYCLKFIAPNGMAYYSTPASGGSTQPYYGVSAFNNIVSKDIPAGTYTVQLAVQNPTTQDYYDVYAPVSSVWRKTAVVTSSTVKFSDYVEPAEGMLSFANESLPATIYYNQPFTAKVTLVNTTATDYSGSAELNLYQRGTTNKLTTLATKELKAAAGNSAPISVETTIASTEVASGNYSIGFATTDGKLISQLKTVSISAQRSIVEGSDFECTNAAVNDIAFHVNLTAREADYSGTVTFAIVRNMNADPVWTKSVNVSIECDKTITQSFDHIDISDLASVGRNYIIYAFYVDAKGTTEYLKGVDRITITPEEETSITDVEAGDAKAEYFDLGGRRVANPAKGIYIRRQGSNTQTVHIK